jgi:putative MATE family efflux protein
MSIPKSDSVPLSERSLFSLAWPVSLTLAVGISQPALDMWFLAQVSDAAAAGVGAMIPVFGALMILLNTLGQAGSSVAGQFLGARRKRLAKATYAFLQALLVGLGVLLGLVMVLASGPITRAMGLQGEIQVHGALFLQVLGCGMGARALWTSMINILASQGLTSWNLWSSLLALGANAGLNFLFLRYGHWGTFGVALATVLSWAVVSFVLLAMLSRKLDYHPHWLDLKLGYRKALRPLVRIGLPATIEPISYQLYLVVLGSQVVRLGTLPLTARVYAATLANIAVVFSYGPGFAAQILTAHLVGAGREDEADRRLKSAAKWACLGALIAGVAVASTARWTLRAFTQDLAVIALGIRLLWIDAILQPAKAANIAYTFSMRAAGDSKFPAVVGTTFMWTAGLGLSLGFCFGAGWGVIGIWSGMVCDEWLRAGINAWRWNTGRWRGKGIRRA